MLTAPFSPPSQLLLYMALAPEEKIKFSEGGPQATSNFDAGVAGYEARAFRGCGVFTSTPVRALPHTPLPRLA